MFPYLQMFKSRVVVTLAAAFLVAAPGLANAQTTGTVTFTVTKYGFVVGTSGGQGVLVFKGKEYPLQLDGISAGMIGMSNTLPGRHLTFALRRISQAATRLQALAPRFGGLEEGP